MILIYSKTSSEKFDIPWNKDTILTYEGGCTLSGKKSKPRNKKAFKMTDEEMMGELVLKNGNEQVLM